MKLVTAEQMRDLDRRAIHERGVPGLQLMECAGAAVARCALEMIEYGRLRRRVMLFAGKGNNGGDAFVAARYLEAEGIRTKTVLLCRRGEITGDARENLRRLDESGAAVAVAETLEALESLQDEAAWVDLLVDGVLGTGVKGKVTGHYAEAIFFINGLHKRVVAIDLPSGLDASRGVVCGVAVCAGITVTMGLPKIGLVQDGGIEHAGCIRVADIGLPGDIVREAPGKGDLMVAQDLYPLFPPRQRETHKNHYGHLLVIAGSPGMTGAACLAAEGALRAGTGLVTVGIPEGLNAIMEVKLTEAMTMPLPRTSAGTLGKGAVGVIRKALPRFDAVIIGPGLSRDTETEEVIRDLVATLEKPVLIDADGINALAGHANLLGKSGRPRVITPHPGEMARLLDGEKEEIVKDAERIATDTASAHGITVVLKGARSLVAGPDGSVTRNATGNPGLATGGSGDVLAGIIAAFMVQGMPPPDAARAGVFVHGAAGDTAALRYGERSLIPGDIIRELPRAIDTLVHRRW